MTENRIQNNRKASLILFLFVVLPLSSVFAQSLTELVSADNVRPGLLVTAGVEDSEILSKLYSGGKFLVHALVQERDVLEKIRMDIIKAGLYGKVSAGMCDMKTLPYADNTVNVLIIKNSAELNPGEKMRVLAPYGMLFEKDGAAYKKTEKPFPKEMDVWRQYAHDPASSYMSQDTLAGPNESIRWIAGDKYYTGRYVSPHVVSAGGRIFFKYHDRGFKGCVEARDAFNGKFLWRMSKTEGVRDFVADDDRLYILHNGKLKALDAATGKHLYNFDHPPNPNWCILHLDTESEIIVFGAQTANWIVGLEAATGKKLWQNSGLVKSWNTGKGVIGNNILYYMSVESKGEGDNTKNEYYVTAVDLKTGEKKREIRDIFQKGDSKQTIAMYLDGKLIVSAANSEIKTRNGCRAYVISPETGKVLWNAETNGGVIRGGGFFFMNGLFYAAKGKGWAGYDPDTGEVKHEMNPTKQNKWHVNHGCDPMVATVNYAIGARMHFIDPVKEEIFHYTVTRTPCRDSVRAANGLVYFPRHTCACTDGMIGNIAISAKSALPDNFNPDDYTPELIKGSLSSPRHNRENSLSSSPLRGEEREGGEEGLARRTPDPRPSWSTYRGNSYRGAYTETELQPDLKESWNVKIGSSASAPAITNGIVYLASPEEHTLHALNAEIGDIVWSFTAGARIDSPPTIYNRHAMFGSRDGFVYCLSAETGELVWKFRAAPSDRKIIVHEQLESIWPVFGSILLEDGVAYASAGRHADIDSGLFIYAFKPETGELVWKRNVRNKEKKNEFSISARLKGAGAVNDILRSDGANLYMAGDFEKRAFDLKTGEPVKPVKRELSQMQKGLAEGKNGIVYEPEAADGDGVPVSRFETSGFITNWLMIGSFPKTEGWFENDMLEKQGGESAFELKPGMELEYTAADGSVKKAVTAPLKGPATNRMLSPRHLDKKLRKDYAYAYCLIRSDKDVMLRGMYGSSGEQKIWVNGEVVDARKHYRNIFQHAYNLFSLKLKKGLNRILVKVGTGRQGWPFYFGITDLPPCPILSTSNDMLLPPSHRALGGGKGDPTNGSIIWVYHPDPEREGMPFHHHPDRFDITPEFGFGADALSFDGYRVFGVGREHATGKEYGKKEQRNKLAVFGRNAWNKELWSTDIDDHVSRLKGVITAGDTVIVALGGNYGKDDQKVAKGRILMYSAEDGKQLKEITINVIPQWDGMAVAGGKLFISSEDGNIICFSAIK